MTNTLDIKYRFAARPELDEGKAKHHWVSEIMSLVALPAA